LIAQADRHHELTLAEAQAQAEHGEPPDLGRAKQMLDLQRQVLRARAGRRAARIRRARQLWRRKWYEQLDAIPEVQELRLIAEAQGMCWGEQAVVSLRAQMCIRGELSPEAADASPLSEMIRSLRGRPPGSLASDKPHWDEHRRELHYRGRCVRRFNRGSAKNQIDVIEAFERAGWPVQIDNPLGPKVHQTLYDLNRGLASRTLRFRADGTGESIIWEDASYL
jgi:hypothetical protein